jgi:undecaprenyl-diphosphatase
MPRSPSFFATPSWDAALFESINGQWRNDLLDIAMPAVSWPWWLLGLAGIYLLWTLLRGRGVAVRLLALVLLVTMAGITDFATNLPKKSIGRIRPLNAVAGTYYHQHGEWQQRPADYVATKPRGTSYPSAHAANTMCMATLIVLIWRLRLWPYLIPLVVGYSRIYLGKHYPSDVMAGWCFGLAMAFAASPLALALARRIEASRKVPPGPAGPQLAVGSSDESSGASSGAKR